MASRATKAGSLAVSPLWKRAFSSNSTPPSAIAATAVSATGPMQSGTKVTGRPIASRSAAASGCRDSLALGSPLGRPKCDSTITLAPRSASSRRVGTTRVIRVASEITPFAIGTLRSTRTSTRLPRTSRPSRRRKRAAVAPIAPPDT